MLSMQLSTGNGHLGSCLRSGCQGSHSEDSLLIPYPVLSPGRKHWVQPTLKSDNLSLHFLKWRLSALIICNVFAWVTFFFSSIFNLYHCLIIPVWTHGHLFNTLSDDSTNILLLKLFQIWLFEMTLVSLHIAQVVGRHQSSAVSPGSRCLGSSCSLRGT